MIRARVVPVVCFSVGILVIAALGAGTAIAQQQLPNSCFQMSIYWVGDPIPPGSDCGYPGEGPFTFFCRTNVNCPPPSWCPTCGKGGAAAANPINLTNGNTYIQETDISIPGLGGGLSLARTWNSMWPSDQSGSQIGIFGPHWRSTYEERVFLGSSGFMEYARSDGAFWMFGGGGSSWSLKAPANLVVTLTSGSTYWTLTFQNGEQRRFSNTSGSLIAIIDRNGNTTQLTYDGLNRLTTVTDPVSRHLYFTYAGSSSYLVTAVTSDIGLSLSYSYDSNGRLLQVTKPDQSTINFGYDSNSLISSVTDSQGKILEAHTYDSQGRGLTSTRANGVDSVTVSYPQ